MVSLIQRNRRMDITRTRGLRRVLLSCEGEDFELVDKLLVSHTVH